jgi:hypothetical protein
MPAAGPKITSPNECGREIENLAPPISRVSFETAKLIDSGILHSKTQSAEAKIAAQSIGEDWHVVHPLQPLMANCYQEDGSLCSLYSDSVFTTAPF